MSLLDDTVSAMTAVTPVQSDTVDLARKPCRGIYVGVSGDVKINTMEGAAATYVGLAAGVIHPIYATRIWTTGTTATSILVIY